MESKITKTELVDRVYEKTGIARKDIKFVVDLVLEEIKNALRNGTAIELRTFGTFEVRRRKGRLKRNPKTGESVSVTTHGIAAFRPGRDLQQDVWNLPPESAEAARKGGLSDETQPGLDFGEAAPLWPPQGGDAAAPAVNEPFSKPADFEAP